MKLIVLGTLAVLTAAPLAWSAERLTPAEFVMKASEAGAAEVELGKLAADKGAAPQVKNFGQRMVSDHTKADTELQAIASKKGLAGTRQLNAMHMKALEELRGKSSNDFDTAFAKQMVMDHNEAVALFTQASALPDAELAAFARKTLPTLKEHQEMAAHLDMKH